jgi:hypothetical protein
LTIGVKGFIFFSHPPSTPLYQRRVACLPVAREAFETNLTKSFRDVKWKEVLSVELGVMNDEL